jgi:hypothetical protein
MSRRSRCTTYCMPPIPDVSNTSSHPAYVVAWFMQQPQQMRPVQPGLQKLSGRPLPESTLLKKFGAHYVIITGRSHSRTTAHKPHKKSHRMRRGVAAELATPLLQGAAPAHHSPRCQAACAASAAMSRRTCGSTRRHSPRHSRPSCSHSASAARHLPGSTAAAHVATWPRAQVGWLHGWHLGANSSAALAAQAPALGCDGRVLIYTACLLFVSAFCGLVISLHHGRCSLARSAAAAERADAGAQAQATRAPEHAPPHTGRLRALRPGTG